MQNSVNRLRFVDIAKGIAMICIILGHLGVSDINKVVFTFHVPIFFFITGYFTSDKRGVKDFINNKVRTLLVPYFITCMVIVIIGACRGAARGSGSEELIRCVIASLYGAGDSYTEPFTIPGIGAIWFLWATFWGSVFLRISLNMKAGWRLAFIIGLFVFGYYSRAICWFPLSIQAGACAAVFMYMGFLLKKTKDYLADVPVEAKVITGIAAAFIWMEFIIGFKSFWLVHCDIGRGIIDIVGCICACSIVVFLSRIIDRKTGFIAGILSFFGKYSLFILCIHIVELQFVPWRMMTGMLISNGMPQGLELPVIIAGKLILDLTLTFILSKIPAVKRLFGMR